VITTGADLMDKIFVRCEPADGARHGVRVLFDPGAPYERRLPPWREVIDALPVKADAA
jgi:hypothetical protein